jgi:hypothetical protein
MVLILGFLLFVFVVIPTFTLGLVVLKEVVKFLWLTLQIVCMFVWEFIGKPIYNRIKVVCLRKRVKNGS